MSMDTYSYKEILLGIKEEGREIHKKLLELEECTEKTDSSIIEYYYWVHRWMASIFPEIICSITKEDKERLLKSQSHTILINNNSHYYFQTVAGLYRNPAKKEKFNSLAHSILNSNYANSMYTEYINGEDYGYQHTLQITPSVLRSAIYKGSDGIVTYQYNFPKNELQLVNVTGEMEDHLIDTVMEFQYPKESFPIYIQEAIEKGKEKELFLDEIVTEPYSISLKLKDNKNKVYMKR